MLISLPSPDICGSTKPAPQSEWDKLVEAAKNEGKLSGAIPASAEMRKLLEENFRKRFGLEVKVFMARGSGGVQRMADEFKAGVRHFDLHFGCSSSITSGMLDEGIVDPNEPWLVLPEVKEPKHWCGGHLWVDNAKRIIYMVQAPTSPRVLGATQKWRNQLRFDLSTIF
jgi:hypothetical protein